MDQPLISVIVPMYKVEKYLKQCLDSIVNQTYHNLEIILVDDGSPDNCGKIADEYAKIDKRIKVLHKPNGGLANARNFGMERMTGNYVLFVDSDDYIATECIMNLYEDIVETESDISIGGTIDFIDSNGRVMNLNYKKHKETYDNINALKELFKEKYITCIVWGRLYRREVLGDERFDDNLRHNEDTEFTYRVFKRANKVVVNTFNVCSYYRIRGDSIIHEKYDKKYEIEIELFKQVLEDVKKNYSQLEKYAIGRLQRCILRLINRYFKDNKETKGVDYLFKEVKKYPMCLDFISRIRLFFLNHFPKVLYFILKIMKRV